MADGLTQKEITTLHTPYVKSEFKRLTTDPRELSIEYSYENMDKEDRIIQLFFDVITNHAGSVKDINSLANSYISIIEADRQITDEQKKIAYLGITMVVYSGTHWIAKNNGTKVE